MVALSEVHTSNGIVEDPQASDSSIRPAPDPRRPIPLNDRPVPNIGARQSRTFASQEAITVLVPIEDTAAPSLGHDRPVAQEASTGDAPTPPKSMVMLPHDGSSSTFRTRSNDLQQRAQSLKARLPSDILLRRDFEVKRIFNKYIVKGKILFSVRWKSTWVPLEAIVQGEGHECSYVGADLATWVIRKQLGSRIKNGMEERKVRWASTREPLENLVNAQQAIANYETTKQQTGRDDMQTVRQRSILTFEGSHFPRGTVRFQSDDDYAKAQRWVASTWPMIRPHRTLDLYPAIYRIQMELSKMKPKAKANHGGKSYRNLMQQPQVRPLKWSEMYIESGKTFHFSRRTRAAIFLQVTGEVESDDPCTRCLGEKLAPFVGCVRTRAGQESWLGGAYANCGTQDYSYCLHHSKGILGRRKSILHNNEADPAHVPIESPASYSQASNRGQVEPYRQPDITPETHQLFNASDSEECSDDSSDEYYDSDDGDDSDEDDDEDHPSEVGNTPQHSHASASAIVAQIPSRSDTKATSSSAAAYPSPSNTTDPPATHARVRKLPKISKTPKTPRVATSPSVPPTPSTTQPSQGTADSADSADSDELGLQPKNVTGARVFGRSLHSGSDARYHNESPVELLDNNAPVDDDYPPEPIEEDTMNLLWKHETPVRSIEDRQSMIGTRLSRANGVLPSVTGTFEADPAARGLGGGRHGSERSTRIRSPPPATANDGGQSSTTTRRKRRADSLSPRSKRLSLGLCGRSSSRPSNDSSLGASSSREKHPASALHPKTFLSIRSLDRMVPGATHQDCIGGQPCNDHENGSRSTPRDPHAIVYKDSLRATTPITVEQAEYILSRCNCYWAWRFARIWHLWCAEEGRIDTQELSQAELSLACSNDLREAAWDCCPHGQRYRGQYEVIELE